MPDFTHDSLSILNLLCPILSTSYSDFCVNVNLIQEWIIEGSNVASNTDSDSASESSSSALSDDSVSSVETCSSSAFSSTSSSTTSSSSSSSCASTDYDRKRKRTRHSIRDFVEITVPSYSEVEFTSHFRLSRDMVYDLIREYQCVCIVMYKAVMCVRYFM